MTFCAQCTGTSRRNLQWRAGKTARYTRSNLPGPLQLIYIVGIDRVKGRITCACLVATIGVPV